MDESEKRFASYLDSHGYAWSFEPDYRQRLALAKTPPTTPDFLVERADQRCVCEVRQFESTRIRDRLARSAGYASFSDKEEHGPLRYTLIEKADQLAAFADTGVPLVIVVSNPLAADVALDFHHVAAAMFGNPKFVIPIDTKTGGAAGPGQHTLEDYGVFASPDPDTPGRWINRHRHISAVGVLHHRDHAQDWRDEIFARHPARDKSFDAAYDAAFAGLDEINERIAAGEEPEGGYEWLDVYEPNPELPTPLPTDWFSGPRDRHYGFTDTGGYAEVAAAEAE